MASKKKKWYAWTRILRKPTIDSKSGAMTAKPFSKPGDEVTPTILGISENEFDELIVAGVIRSTPYPKIGRFASPKQHLLAEARKAMEIAQSGGGIDDPNDEPVDDDAGDGTV